MIPVNPNTSTTKIGWIGTGIMGASMCSHIVKNGYKTFVHNRTQGKAAQLIQIGAIWCSTPLEVVNNSDIIFTIVGFPSDVREVYFGDRGIFGSLWQNKIVVDMTTTEPSLSVEIYATAENHGWYSVDAPVSGGDIGAKSAQLSIMTGGDKDVIDSIKPLLSMMGSKIFYHGPPGSGQHAKMCNQITVASTMIGICESLLYCYNIGLDQRTIIKALCSGAAHTWLMENLAPMIVNANFSPGFFVEHFIKDLGIAVVESEKMKLELPGLKMAKRLYERARELGHGRSGTQALYLALRDVS